MKAWVLHSTNDLRFDNVPMPQMSDNDVLVKVKAASICQSDIPRVYSSGAYRFPIILGHEFSGLTPDGRRVGVFPLLPCFACFSCQSGNYETCLDYSYLGSRQDGAFAEYVAVPSFNLIDIPDSMSFEQAALLEPAAVALHAARRVDSGSMETAVVVGNGVIGCLISKWLLIFGIDLVDVIGRNDSPRLDSYDVCFEAAGTTDALRNCVELLRSNGQLVLIGNPYAGFSIDQKLYWQFLRKQLNIKGSWNSSFPGDWQMVIDLASQLQLDTYISHTFKFSELLKGFDMIYNKTESHKRIVVTFD